MNRKSRCQGCSVFTPFAEGVGAHAQVYKAVRNGVQTVAVKIFTDQVRLGSWHMTLTQYRILVGSHRNATVLPRCPLHARAVACGAQNIACHARLSGCVHMGAGVRRSYTMAISDRSQELCLAVQCPGDAGF